MILENCEIISGEKVALDKLVCESKMSKDEVTKGMIRQKFKYNKDLCGMGINPKTNKCGFNNIKFIECCPDSEPEITGCQLSMPKNTIL